MHLRDLVKLVLAAGPTLLCLAATAAPVTTFTIAGSGASYGVSPFVYDSSANSSATGAAQASNTSLSTTGVALESRSSVDLSLGQLKAYAAASNDRVDVGAVNASSRALIGDSLSLSGQGGLTTISVQLDGSFSRTDGEGLIPFVGTVLTARVYSAGTLNALFNSLAPSSGTIYGTSVPLSIHSLSLPPTPETYDDLVTFQFNAPSAFDIVISLEVYASTFIETEAASAEFTEAIADFFNTAHVSLTAPQGQALFSASGQLPGTRALPPINQVPEPTSGALLLLALLTLSAFVRYRSLG